MPPCGAAAPRAGGSPRPLPAGADRRSACPPAAAPPPPSDGSGGAPRRRARGRHGAPLGEGLSSRSASARSGGEVVADSPEVRDQERHRVVAIFGVGPKDGGRMKSRHRGSAQFRLEELPV